MENLSNRFALRTKFLITIFQKWFKDTQKKIVEVQINGALEIGHEEKTKTSDQFQSVSQSRTDTPCPPAQRAPPSSRKAHTAS